MLYVSLSSEGFDKLRYFMTSGRKHQLVYEEYYAGYIRVLEATTSRFKFAYHSVRLLLYQLLYHGRLGIEKEARMG
jgi:hypothetical protein